MKRTTAQVSSLQPRSLVVYWVRISTQLSIGFRPLSESHNSTTSHSPRRLRRIQNDSLKGSLIIEKGDLPANQLPRPEHNQFIEVILCQVMAQRPTKVRVDFGSPVKVVLGS